MNQIMESLEQNILLRYLNLSWNQMKGPNKEINDEIIKRFGGFVVENRSLLHLQLDSVNIQGEYMTKLSKMLGRSSSLLSIHLSGNPMTARQLRYLRKCLKI